jgi:CDP-glucose 4,6-dehydratase
MVNPSPEFWRSRRVLITGHTGFKGSWLTMWLHQLGAEIIGLSLDDRTPNELFQTARVSELCTSIYADVRQPEKWSKKVLDFGPEVVFHLAAQSLVRDSYDEPVHTFDVNVMGTVYLLEELRHHASIKSVVIVTTDKVYRDVEKRIPFQEDHHLGGHDPYSASKAACELVVASFKKSFFDDLGIAISSARAGNVIGGGDWASNRIIPDAVRAWTHGRILEIRNPDHTRPWQHVLEPLLGYLILAEKTYGDPSMSSSYNFGPAEIEQRSVSEIIEICSKYFPQQRYVTAPRQDSIKHESHWLNLDSSRAFEIFGIRSRLSTEEAVNWTMTWYLESSKNMSNQALCFKQINQFLEYFDSTS